MAQYTNYALSSGAGTLNGSTPVTVVAAPSAGQALTVKNLTVQNADTVQQTVTVNFKISATSYAIWSGILQPGDSLVLGEEDIYALTATTHSLTVVMGGAATTNNPNYVVCWSIQS